MNSVEDKSEATGAVANVRIASAMKSRHDFSIGADKYDTWFQTREGKLYDRFEKDTIRKYLPPAIPGKQLLDVGCGTGHWSKFFSEYGYTVTGIDVSEAMIEIARAKQVKEIEYVIGDTHELPFPDSQFDVSAAITAIEFVRDPAGVIREMVRCTKKRGGVVILGVLNCCATINRKRRNKGISPYHHSCMLSPRQLYYMMVPFGKPTIITSGFVPRWEWLMPVAPLSNAIGTALRLPTGALTIGVIEV